MGGERARCSIKLTMINIALCSLSFLSLGSSFSAIQTFSGAPYGKLKSRPYNARRHSNTLLSSNVAEDALEGSEQSSEEDSRLPDALIPIWLGVFVQMLGEGIAISSLPLHMMSMGASPVQAGMATSCFSVAQMICCPLLVSASGRLGRSSLLRICLAGAAVSNLVISCSSTTVGVVAGRSLAGIFAASVPVAQAASADVVSPSQTTRALARVSASSQLGVVVGPAVVAIMATLYGKIGVPSHLTTRAVFATSSIFALLVLAISTKPTAGLVTSASAKQQPSDAVDDISSTSSIPSNSGTIGIPKKNESWPVKFVQPCLRLIALACGWSLTLSVGTYCLFGGVIMGFPQSKLSATFSAGAAITIATQLAILPRLAKRVGEFRALSIGLLLISSGLAGCVTVLTQPWHTMLYILNRIGNGIGDTSTAALVSKFSTTKSDRARNLGLVQSTRAAARIVTPLLSGYLFDVSSQRVRFRGGLPYLCLAALTMALSPLPLALKRVHKAHGGQQEETNSRE